MLKFRVNENLISRGLLTPAKDDVVNHFYSFEVKDSDDLKVKVQSFCTHPGEAGSVQEMK